MKRFLQILISVSAVLAVTVFALTRTPQTNRLDASLERLPATDSLNRINTIIDAYVADYRVPSLVIGIVAPDQPTVFLQRGHFSRCDERPVDENTVYQLGSLSKTFTGIVARSLTEEGLLDPEASILDYLPGDFTAAERDRLAPITVLHLLRHQSGLPRIAPSYEKGIFGRPPTNVYSRELLLRDLKSTTLTDAPGTALSYSNFGYGVLGLVLETASGRDFQELLQDYVARPHGMSRTTATFHHSTTHDLPTPYVPELRYLPNGAHNFASLTPGGGVFSTATDLSQLMTAQMTAYRANATASPLYLTTATVAWAPDYEWSPDYGYGFFHQHSRQGRYYGHTGDVDGFASSYTFNVEQGIGLVLLTSMGGPWFAELERDLRRELYGATAK